MGAEAPAQGRGACAPARELVIGAQQVRAEPTRQTVVETILTAASWYLGGAV